MFKSSEKTIIISHTSVTFYLPGCATKGTGNAKKKIFPQRMGKKNKATFKASAIQFPLVGPVT